MFPYDQTLLTNSVIANDYWIRWCICLSEIAENQSKFAHDVIQNDPLSSVDTHHTYT